MRLFAHVLVLICAAKRLGGPLELVVQPQGPACMQQLTRVCCGDR